MNIHVQPAPMPQRSIGPLEAAGMDLGLAGVPQTSAHEFSGGLSPWQEKRVVRYIVEHATGTLQVGELAEIARLSVSHFSRAFRHSFGTPPYALVCRYRIREAIRLMLNTTWSLVEIAAACGFADQSHFTRAFQRHTGTSPGRWRRLHIGSQKISAS